MADVLYRKHRRFEKKAEVCVQRKKDVTETESSIFRQLEKEDFQRFKAISEEVDGHGIRKTYENKTYEQDNANEQRRESTKKLEKIRRNPGRKELMRSKGQRIGRFLQKRISNRVNKRWHSDSELLDSMSKEASVASRKSKLVEDLQSAMKKTDNKNDSIIPNPPKMHQKKMVRGCRQVTYHEAKDNVDLGATLEGEDDKDIKDRSTWTKNDEVCHWMNCSFPATARDNEKRQDVCEYGEGNASASGVLNLLVEYFKDLNKEVREFREEKKKTREQIQNIELTVEKVLLRLEVEDVKFQSRSSKELQNGKLAISDSIAEGKGNEDILISQGKVNHVSTRKEDVCIEFETRSDIRQEIRNILADVHEKYQKQLSDHEMRMKCVQEKAEYDIQKLMKTIIGNYVELSKLRGSGKELGKLMIQRKIEDGEKYTASTTMEEKLASSIDKGGVYPEEKAKVLKMPSDRSFKATNSGSSPKTKAETVRNSYQFYFPRETRADCVSLDNREKWKPRNDIYCSQKDDDLKKQSKSIDTTHKNKAGKIIAVKEMAGNNCGHECPTENLANAEAKISDSSCPEGLGASYLEWKKYWCDKLSKRNSLLKASRDKMLKKGQGGCEAAREEGRCESAPTEDESQDVRSDHVGECNRNNI